jgi:hypothetical protein
MRTASRLLLIVATLFIVGCSSGSDRGSSDSRGGADTTPANFDEDNTNLLKTVDTSQADAESQSGSAPNVSLAASADVVDAGGSVTLSWSSRNATTCSASGGWSGTKSVSGQQLITSLQNNQTFTLNCEGAGGSAIAMVSVAVNGSLQLSWQVPTENVDGTPIEGLSVFRIHYGTISGSYDKVVEVSGSTTSHTMELAQGEYYLAMTAVDLDGDESGLSNEVIKQAI